MRSGHTASKTKDDAANEATELTSARARQEDATCIYAQKCNEAAVAKTNYTNAKQDVLGNTDALEQHVKRVTMRAESLLTAESDFFQMIHERHEEAQNHLNALSVQLSTAAAATEHAPKAT